ncbi:MAG: porphobilinogen synthase [Phycisphaerae bacterium]
MKNNAHSHIRMRRLRRNELIRDLAAETSLSPADLIVPLFVRLGEDIRRPIMSMPGQFQFSPDMAVEELREMASRGLRAFILFGITEPGDKDETGQAAHDPNNAVCTTLRRVRDAGVNMLAITDLCYCEYTSHGHCGPLTAVAESKRSGKRRSKTARSTTAAKSAKWGIGDAPPPSTTVDNDATIERLAHQAVLHAQAGADMIAPSGMMDHATGAIRTALDSAGFLDRSILSYSVKYASSYYGPFREAAESPPQFGDRRSYQMDFRRSSKEAVREALLDVQEGADMVMVKPAMPYLDILAAVSAAVPVPTAVYQVSGEYAMFKAAAAAGWIDEKAIVLETMHSFKRAGAACILTYYAAEIAEWLQA